MKVTSVALADADKLKPKISFALTAVEEKSVIVVL